MLSFNRLISSCAMGALAVAMVAPIAVMAQETTADIRGSISGNNAAIANANIVITHIASGTRATAKTDASGVFVVSGLRAGGPYSVDVDAAGFQGATVSDVYLSVSEPFNMALSLKAVTGETIVVQGTRTGIVRADGTVTALRKDTIDSLVVVNRDIRELARLSPLATANTFGDGGISIAGSNPRTNRVTIDGVAAQDDFGLNTGGLPTRRGPVSVDAISQFNISATPFDVRNGGFLGGAIDLVLASGDNKLHGTLFGKFQDEKLTGSWIDGTRVKTVVDQTNYGATLRGPILKDKLFYALSYETFETSDGNSRGPADKGFVSTIVGPTGANLVQADIDAITNIYYNTYKGDRALGEIAASKPVTDEKYSLRLDYNITDKQRAAFTYRKATSEVFNFTNLGATTASLDSQWYMTGEDDETYTLQLNSAWTDKLSTEVRLSYRDYERLQEPPGGQNFSDVSVCTTATSLDAASNPTITCASSTGSGRAVVRFGPDQFRHANYLATTNTQGQFEARYRLGGHELKGGFQTQMRDVYNLFVSSSDGVYYFDSVADFQAGKANRLQFTNAPSGNPDDAAAQFEYSINSLYAQDNWRIHDTFRLNLGLRYDFYKLDQKPVENVNFLARNGFANTTTYDGLDILMPRVSFNWTPYKDLKISGGIGLFSGGLPDVFMSNSFSNTGIATVGVDIQRLANGTFTETGSAPGFTQAIGSKALDNLVSSGFGKSVPAEVLALLGGVTPSPTSEVNALDPDFKVPADWKANIAINKEVWGGVRAGLDLVMTRVQTGYAFKDLRATPLIVNGTQALTPDGRKRYDALSTAQRAVTGYTVTSTSAAIAKGAVSATSSAISNRDILLYNPDGDLGQGFIGAISLSKKFDFGVNLWAAYTYQNIEEGSSSGRFSSTASSLYGGQFSNLDPNSPAYGRAQEEIRNSFKYSVDWKGSPFGELETRLSLFGDKRSGRPINFIMNGGSGRNTVFGVNKAGQLAYIPNFSGLASGTLTTTSTGVSVLSSGAIAIAGDSKVVFNNISDLNNLRNLVEYFGLPQGAISERSGIRNEDMHLVNVKLSQEIPSFIQGHKAKVEFELANALNLLNDEWGRVNEYGDTQTLYSVSCADNTGSSSTALAAVSCTKYRISNSSTFFTNAPTRNLGRSLWQITVGLRYEF